MYARLQTLARRAMSGGGLAKILRGGFWLLMGKGLYIGSMLLLNVILARTLAPEAVSIFVLVQGGGLLLGMATSLSVGQAAVRFVGEVRGDRPARVPTVIRAALLLGFLVSATAAFLVGVFPGPWLLARVGGVLAAYAAYLVPLTVWTLAIALRVNLFNANLGIGEFRVGAWFDGAVGTALAALVLGGLWAAGRPADLGTALAICVAGALFEPVVGTVILLRKLRHLGGGGPAEPWPGIGRALAARGLPLMLAHLIVQLMLQIPLWFLSATRPLDEVALLGIAYRLMVAVGVVFTLSNQAFLPDMARLVAAGQKAELERLLARTNPVIFGLCLAMALPIMLFAETFLGLVFGPAYVGAAWPLIIMVLAQLTQVAVGPAYFVMDVSGREREFLYLSIATCLLVPLLCLVLIPPYGPTGAALAMLISMVLRAGASLYLCWRLCGVLTVRLR